MKVQSLFLKPLLLTGALVVCPGLVFGAADSKPGTANSGSGKPIAQWTCADFIAVQDSFKPYAVGWTEGYSKSGKPEDEIMSVDGVETMVPYLVTVCQQNKKMPLKEAVKSASSKKMPGKS